MNVSEVGQRNDVSRGSLRSYVTGLILALTLTIIPFWIIMRGVASHTTALVVIVAFALVQIVVHLVFFLRLNGSSDQRWNLIVFLFTVLIVGLLVGGSLWIMYNLNHNMMPMPMGNNIPTLQMS